MASFKHKTGLWYALYATATLLLAFTAIQTFTRPPDDGKAAQGQEEAGDTGATAEPRNLLCNLQYPPLPKYPDQKQGSNKVQPELKQSAIKDGETAERGNSVAEEPVFRYSPCMLPPPPEPEREIFRVVEIMPYLVDCQDTESPEERWQCSSLKILEFLLSHFQYSKEACVEGTVVVSFIVNREGRMESPQLLRDIGGGAGEEALRVLQLMADQEIRWVPGRQRGRPVDVQMGLPLKICLKWEAEEAEAAEVVAAETATEANVEKETGQKLEAPHPSGTPQHKNTLTAGFRLFPNPASELINVRLQAPPAPVAMSIINLSGQLLWNQEYANSDGFLEEQVNLVQWPSGTYCLRIEQHGNVQTHLFVKK